MNACRVTQDQNAHYERQEALAADSNQVRLDRYREDRKLVRANASLLLTKTELMGKRTQWSGAVYLGSVDCKWDYVDVVGRASEDDKYYGYAIDLTSPDVNTHLTAARLLKGLVQKAALEIAFESLDIGDVWLDVDELFDWEPER